MFFKPSIPKEIKKRGLALLLHSTHLHKNLPLILTDGRIHTAQELIARYGQERAARLLHDPHRYEQFTVGLNYVNASLTVPNVQLLYHRSQSEWQAEWVHFALDLSLLDLPTTRFSPVSAAAGCGQFIATGLDGFQAMFADSVETYSRHHLPLSEPTHPQAEVLIQGSVDLGLVNAIYVPHRNTLLEVARLCERHLRSIPIHIAPHLFVWPARLAKSFS
jgi:hypothetical protein